MNWRWLILNYIDPKLKLTLAQRRQVMARVLASRGVCLKVGLVSGPVILALLIAGFPLLERLLDLCDSLRAEWLWMVTAGLSMMAFYLTCLAAGAFVAGFAIRRAVRDSLHAFGYELCAKCGRQLLGLDDYEQQCPACGTEREPIGCHNCGYPLYLITSRKLICPECGSNQRVVREYGRWSWLWFLQVAPVFGQLPDPVRRGLQRRALVQGSTGFLIVAGSMAVLTMSAVLCWYLFIAPGLRHSDPVSPLVKLFMSRPADFMLALIVAKYPGLLAIWLGAAALAHRTYGSALRRHVRNAGYDVCRHCGRYLIDLDAAAADCPECGRSRVLMSDSVERDLTMPTPAELALLDGVRNELRWSGSPGWRALTPSERIQSAAFIGLAAVVFIFTIVWPVPDAYEQLQERALWAMSPLIVAGVIWQARIWRVCLRRKARRELRQRGHEVCVNCGAWLRGLDSEVTQCPLCDGPRELMASTDASAS